MTDQRNHTIAVAMSGGVDSTVCAAMLAEHERVHGFFMDLGLPDREEQIERVETAARLLGLPLEIIDLASLFQQEVIDYFCHTYYAGHTPNPCVRCNPLIKCGALLLAVQERGVQHMATGHYARLLRDEDGVHLLRGRDHSKDQSYFLCHLRQWQLQRLRFPLGEMSKEEVFATAHDLGLSRFAAPEEESQDICFLKKRSVADFLQEKTAPQAGGEIVDAHGRRLGEHQGCFLYTIGQRRGLGLCDPDPFYVIGLDAGANRVIVGRDHDLWSREAWVAEMNWLSDRPVLSGTFQVRIRSRHRPAPAWVERQNDLWRIHFQQEQRAVTPGQFAVLYQGEELVGGGEIVDSPAFPKS